MVVIFCNFKSRNMSKKHEKLLATLKRRAMENKKYNSKTPEAANWNYQVGIIMSQNEYDTLMEYHQSLYNEIFLLRAQVSELKVLTN